MAKVLLIDDDEGVRASVAKILASGGHDTVVAVNGLDGIDALIRTRFDLVITDILMPVQEGIETIQRVRELDPEIPIIAISGAFGQNNYSVLDDARLIGADLAIEKPFSVEKLLDGVTQVLEKGHRT
jgi:CheY-like chemotaxis protein